MSFTPRAKFLKDHFIDINICLKSIRFTQLLAHAMFSGMNYIGKAVQVINFTHYTLKGTNLFGTRKKRPSKKDNKKKRPRKKNKLFFKLF